MLGLKMSLINSRLRETKDKLQALTQTCMNGNQLQKLAPAFSYAVSCLIPLIECRQWVECKL